MGKRFDINAEYPIEVGDLAYLVALTERRIQQLEVEGVVTRLEHGKYDLVESVRSILEFTRNSVRGSAASEAEKKERVKLTRAKRKIAEMKQQEIAGELVRAEVMRRHLYQLGRIQKSTLESLPDRVAAIVAGESDRAKCHEILIGEIRQSLNNLIEQLEQTLVDDPRIDANLELDD